VLPGTDHPDGRPPIDIQPQARMTKGAYDVNHLYRPRDDRWVAGVCAGLARRFGISSGLVRLIFVVSCVLPGPQFLIYLILWAMMPNE
jgi:phage shock protein PspC (stress-responsive transcriptional regulator)